MAKKAYIPPPDPDFHALALAGYKAWLRDEPERLAFDTETHGVQFHDQPFCVTVSWGSGSYYFELEKYDSSDLVSQLLKETPVLVGHNIKFDLQKCILKGIISRGDLLSSRIEDTEALAHLTDEHRKKALKSLAVEVLGIEDTIEITTASGPNKGQVRHVPREKHELDAIRRKLKKKKEDGYGVIPRAVIVPYALKDAEFTSDLYDTLFPDVAQYEDLHSLYRQEMTLTLVLLDMEGKGLGVDMPYVRKKVTEYQNRVLVIENRIEEMVGKPVRTGAIPPKERHEYFNPSSSSPDAKEFFTELGYERASYDEENLNEIPHPLAATLLELRSDQKILSTYLLALLRGSKQEGEVFVFHPSIRQHGTVTGRTSSGGAKGDDG